jgi:hypothetical protein
MAVAEARILAPVEVAEIESRLQNRDPQLDLHRAFPNLILTLRARDAEIRGQVDSVVKAQQELRETTERYEALQLEMTRERAVIEAARRMLASVGTAGASFAGVVADFDSGKTVLG